MSLAFPTLADFQKHMEVISCLYFKFSGVQHQNIIALKHQNGPVKKTDRRNAREEAWGRAQCNDKPYVV